MLLDEKKKSIYFRLIRYAKPYKLYIAISIIASLGVAGTDAAIAYLVKPFVDELLVAGNFTMVKFIPFIVIGFSVIKGLSRYFQEYNIRQAGQLAIQDVRNELFSHSVYLSMSFFTRHSSGSLMSRILNDVNQLQKAFSDTLVSVMKETLTMVTLTGYAFYTDWKMALMAFVVVPSAAWPAAKIGKKIKKFSKRGQHAMGDLTGVLEQSFSGVKVIKAFATEKEEVEKFKLENFNYYTFVRKTFRYSAGTAPVMEILTSLGVATVLWYGLNQVIAEELTKGEMFSILAAVLLMYGPLKNLTKVNNVLQRAIGAGERVFEVLDQQSEISDAPDALELPHCQGRVEFEEVTFSYNDEPVLQNFSVEVKPGEVIALVGPSGAGKTTIVSLLNRFYDPQAGRILIDGHDIRGVKQDSLHANMALVDQETFLFNSSIRDNICFGRKDADDAAVTAAIRQAYAEEFIQQLPEGLETVIGNRGLRLSGGQRQRICIARAILRDAPILLLDEATSALDTESEAMVQMALGNLMQGRTTIVIAHRLSTIMDADRILVLENGRLQESGSHQQLLAKAGLYKRLYDIQFREQE